MTNTITKITYDGEDYKVGGNDYTAGTGISISASNEISNSGVTSFNGSTGAVTYTPPVTSVNSQTGAVTVNEVPSGGTDGQFLGKVSGSLAWANPTVGDVTVSTQANNILTTGMKIRAGEESDYAGLGTYDSNTLYLTIPDSN